MIPSTLQGRIDLAARFIMADRWKDNRECDNCFEMGDGDEVVRGLVLLAATKPKLKAALKVALAPHHREHYVAELS